MSLLNYLPHYIRLFGGENERMHINILAQFLMHINYYIKDYQMSNITYKSINKYQICILLHRFSYLAICEVNIKI